MRTADERQTQERKRQQYLSQVKFLRGYPLDGAQPDLSPVRRTLRLNSPTVQKYTLRCVQIERGCARLPANFVGASPL